MSGGHSIAWTIDHDRVRGVVTCHEPEGAACRLVGGNDCECESWYVERDEQGPFHVAVAYDDEDNESDVKHRMVDGGSCSVVDWMQDTGVEDSHIGPEQSLRDGAIQVEFDDGYLWRYPAVS